MHIAFLTPEYPHEKVQHAAGIGTSIKNLVTALADAGIVVSVFVYGQQCNEVFVENGIKIHILAHKHFRFFTWYRYRKYLQNYLNQYIHSDKIDLVEAPDWTGITAFMKLRAPLVIRFHGSDAYFCHLEKRKQKLKNFFFEKLGVQKGLAYIAPTNYAGKISQNIFGIKDKPITTIHYGLSLPYFNNPSPAVFTKGMILYIGTIIRKKGVFELPDILTKVLVDCPEAHLVLIGADSYDIKTKSNSTWNLIQEKLNETLNNRIKYLGKIPYEQVQEYIKNANVCVFPTFAETLGMVTIESMAMQKPVVNSNIGWANELIKDGIDGYLVHPENHELYAQRIVELLKNQGLALNIGITARQRVEKYFDIKKIATQNVQFYDKIIKNNR